MGSVNRVMCTDIKETLLVVPVSVALNTSGDGCKMAHLEHHGSTLSRNDKQLPFHSRHAPSIDIYHLHTD